jgi:hypothetical protein
MLGTLPAMPSIELSDSDLQLAAQGARMGAIQAEKDASQQSSPSVRGNFEATASRYRELAKKLDQARKLPITTR